jgi:hypothetical protein
LCGAFADKTFQLLLAYLVDVFEAINSLGLKLQGRNANIIAHYDAMRAFMEKIQLFKYQLKAGNNFVVPSSQ